MMKLIGRGYEIEKLKKMLIPDQPDFLAVYGRRRLTKITPWFVPHETIRTWIEYFISEAWNFFPATSEPLFKIVLLQKNS